MIKKEFRTSPSLFYRAGREIHSSSSRCNLCGYGAIAFALLLSVLYRNEPGMFFFGVHLWVLLVGVASFFLIVPLIQYFAMARAWKSSPSMSASQQYEISEGGVRNHGSGFGTELSWEMIRQVRVSPRFVFFFTSKSCAQFIPRDLLSEAEIAQIQEWKNGVKGQVVH